MIDVVFITCESFSLHLLTEEIRMKTVGQKIEAFAVTGVKPGFNQHEEKGVSAFEPVTEKSFPGKWKVIYFYPKDFTFVCPTEIVGFAKLAQDFADRDAVVLGGSTDNEFARSSAGVATTQT
jgi:peroxiredoxin (alkyl hydroperoxide reductase subunit C)